MKLHEKNEDKYQIGAALKKARKEAGIKTVPALVNRLEAKGITIAERTVRNWEGDTARPSIDMLLMLCDLYGCDLDYLTGRTEYAKGLKASHIYTGLSETALETLHKWRGSNYFVLFLSSLIENNLFGRVLAAVMNYYSACHTEKRKSENTIAIDTGDLIPSAPDITLWNATNKFTQCLEDTFGHK